MFAARAKLGFGWQSCLDELLRPRIEFGVLNLNTEGNVTPAYVVNTNMSIGLMNVFCVSPI